jgi:hypothetical protein
MFDTGPDDGFSGIGPLDMTGHRLEMRIFPMNPGDKAIFFHEGFSGF